MNGVASTPLLIIVTGLPATGKTTLGRHLAQALLLPFIHKDGIKELLFDTLGWSDIAWSQQLGRASIELLYYFAGAQLRAGKSCVLESNFDAALAAPRFAAMSAQSTANFVQIVCSAKPAVIWRRYQERWAAGQKHPGHVQHLDPRADSWIHWPQGKALVMDIGGEVIELDTTDFERVDFPAVVARLRQALHSETQNPA